MKQFKTVNDNRLDTICSYCGENMADTRDHVPSKILLEEPYPENLPVVPCCSKCNQGFSLDEEYLACLIECVICGSIEIEKLSRQKIKIILCKKEALRMQLSNSIIYENDNTFFIPEIKRLKNVFIKLAKGHFKYENSEQIIDEPTHWNYKPLFLMTLQERKNFFEMKATGLLPEIGSRAMIKSVTNNNNMLQTFVEWNIVQQNVYHYAVSINPIIVRMIIWNYLAVEVGWEDISCFLIER